MTAIDNNIVRSASPAELSRYLLLSLSSSSVHEISQYLLAAVEQGSIDPVITFGVWLGTAKSPTVLKHALKQDVSIQVRKLGIKRLAKELRRKDWEKTWDGLGGTPGLIELFSDLSALEVRDACRLIIKATRGHFAVKKRENVTDLLEGLLQRIFPKSRHRNTDERFLSRYYGLLIPGCTPELFKTVYTSSMDGDWPEIPLERASKYQPESLQHLCLDTIFGEEDLDLEEWLPRLLRRLPPGAGSDDGFSASMQFSMDLLRRLATGATSNFPDHLFLDELVEPLLRRAKRRRVPWILTEEIVNLAGTYLESHPEAAESVDPEFSLDVIHLVVRCWAQEPMRFQDSLCTFLRVYLHEDGGWAQNMTKCESILEDVPRDKRYTLFRQCLLETPEDKQGGDIDVDEDLSRMDVDWYANIFELLDGKSALELLKRLRKIKRGKLNIKSSGNLCTGFLNNGDLLLTSLTRRSGSYAEAEKLGEKFIEESKKFGAHSTQATRAEHAQLAMFFAIVSGSLALYKDTVMWSRRYIRDPLTVSTLFGRPTDDAATILSGIPEDLTGWTDSGIKERIIQANGVLYTLFQTACLALREPSFAVSHWHRTLELFQTAIIERERNSRRLKNSLNLLDDSVYELLWEDTLDLLLKVEGEALEPGHARLEWNSLNGPLSVRYPQLRINKAHKSTFHFLDQLAKARDQLWREFRPTVHPAVTTLPTPFPRGLPLQHLTGPLYPGSFSTTTLTPYIASRAQVVVFMDADDALTLVPEDEEMLAAIGPFVDEYDYACNFWLFDAKDAEHRNRRSDIAWRHIVDHLCGRPGHDPLSPEEALRFWNYDHTYKRHREYVPAIGRNPIDTSRYNYPVVPSGEDISVTEWNPLPPVRRQVKEQPLRTTYLDLSKSLARVFKHPTHDDNSPTCTPVIPGEDSGVTDIWTRSRNWKNRCNREGQIISALLYLDSKKGSNASVLSSPFPSNSDQRYPHIFLDEQFLVKPNLKINSALCCLERLSASIPPPLLLNLTEATLAAIDHESEGEQAPIEIEQMAFRLVSVLAKSDRPSRAIDHAIRIIVQRPDASSWHRRLLTSTFLRRLPASQARVCIQSFASTIISKLVEQAKAKQVNAETGKANEGGGETSQPHIKITTVKYLAQLLKGADFVSERFTIDVLQSLLRNSTHFDIRLNVVESLLSLFGQCGAPVATDVDQSSSPANKIMEALECILPVAGGLDEENPMKEDDWKSAENNNEPPNISSYRPLTHRLLSLLKDVSDGFAWRQEYTNRISLPLVDILKKNTARWLAIFLRKYDDDSLNDIVWPQVPKEIDIPDLLAGSAEYVPADVLDQHVVHTIFNIRPPIKVARFAKKLRDDPDINENQDAKWFLSLYTGGIGDGGMRHIQAQCALLNMFQKDFKPSKIENGITVQQAQRLLLQLFTAILHVGNNQKNIDELTKGLKPPVNCDDEDEKAAWTANAKPVVEAMTVYIDSMRTRDWQNDADRFPVVLPDTFQWRIWLLPYPSMCAAGSLGEQCKVFADAVSKMVDQFAGTRYHSKFTALQGALHEMKGDESVVVACLLGDIVKTKLSWLTTQDQLRVELAEGMLRNAEPLKDISLLEKTKCIIEVWKKSNDEDVRRWGLALGEHGMFKEIR